MPGTGQQAGLTVNPEEDRESYCIVARTFGTTEWVLAFSHSDFKRKTIS
jgi:hypothetical protein